jgi:hypothetical protein
VTFILPIHVYRVTFIHPIQVYRGDISIPSTEASRHLEQKVYCVAGGHVVVVRRLRSVGLLTADPWVPKTHEGILFVWHTPKMVTFLVCFVGVHLAKECNESSSKDHLFKCHRCNYSSILVLVSNRHWGVKFTVHFCFLQACHFFCWTENISWLAKMPFL